MTTDRLERAVCRNAASSLAAYRRAARDGQHGPEWPAVAAGLASAVDLLLGLLDDEDSRDGVLWAAVSDMRTRTDRNTRQLDDLLAVCQAAGADIPAPEQQQRARLTVLPGGRTADRTGGQAQR